MILKTLNIDSLKGKDEIVLECKFCHNDFKSTKAKYMRTFYTDSKLLYCSSTCSENAQKKRISYKCSNCGCDIEKTPSQAAKSKNHFCSSSCAAKFNNHRIIKRQKSAKICVVCNNKYTDRKGRKTCSKNCEKQLKLNNSISASILEHKTKGEVRNGNSFKENRYVKIRTHAQRMYRKNLLPYICVKCGYDKHVEICHIKAIADFDDSALISEINSKENLIALCPNCHWEFDHNFLSLKE